MLKKKRPFLFFKRNRSINKQCMHFFRPTPSFRILEDLIVSVSTYTVVNSMNIE